MNSYDIKAIIFDMDGLMFDTERIGLEGFIQAAKNAGYFDHHKIFSKMIGRTVKDADQMMVETFGKDFPIAQVREGRKEFINNTRKRNGIPKKKGLDELISFLKETAIPRAIATSSHREIMEEHLNNHSLIDFFQVSVCGDEIENGKPDPEIFLKAAFKMDVDPRTCIVLEDSPSGVHAAHSANMIPIMIPDLQEPTPEIRDLAHRVFPSLVEVKKYFITEKILIN